MNHNSHFGKEGMTWRRRAIFIPFAIKIFSFGFSILVMYLWNTILPGVIGVHTITFWQALTET
jgi:hypothetical protein